jgi:hypothetical protein
MTDHNNLLVIDGDFIAFLAASTVVERYVDVVHPCR